MDLTSPFNFNIAAMQLVYTPKGVMFAEKVSKGDQLFANTDPQIQELANSLAIGNKPGYQIFLKNGTNFSLGHGCQVYTTHGWKDIAELKPQDLILQKLIISAPNLNPGGNVINYTQQLNTDAMPILVPKKMSKDFAHWLGIFYAVGEFNHHDGKISIKTKDLQVAQEYSALTEKVFKLSPLTMQDPRPGRSPEYYFISQNITKFLNTNMGRKHLQKIPSFLLEGSTDEHWAFITGLAVKARPYKKNNLIIYQGYSKLVAEFVSLVLRHNGYTVSQYKEDFSANETKSDRYTVIITGKHPQGRELNLAANLQPLAQKSLKVLVDISAEFANLKIRSFDPHYKTFQQLSKKDLKICSWNIAEAWGITNHNLYYLVPVTQINYLKNIKQVTFKVLYPDGLLLNNTVLAGQY